VRRIACSLLLLTACARRDDPTIAPVSERRPKIAVVEPGELPLVRTKVDLARHDHRRVVVEGWYEIVPVPGGKAAQPAYVVLLDGTRVIRSYRPIPSELGYADRRVRVTGNVTIGPPDARIQAMAGPHVEAERVELAAGETPITPTPSEIPTPPIVTSLPGFAPHLDRWVAVHGTLDALTPGADPPWAEARIRLADGGTVLVGSVVEATWRPLVGRVVTTLGRVSVIGRDAGLGLDVRLDAAGAPCAGLEARCGMMR
jgi:hypothetical protein